MVVAASFYKRRHKEQESSSRVQSHTMVLGGGQDRKTGFRKLTSSPHAGRLQASPSAANYSMKGACDEPHIYASDMGSHMPLDAQNQARLSGSARLLKILSQVLQRENMTPCCKFRGSFSSDRKLPLLAQNSLALEASLQCTFHLARPFLNAWDHWVVKYVLDKPHLE